MKLHFLNGAREGTEFMLKQNSVCKIGRETDNDIQLLLAGVSRYHAVIDCDNDKWILRDIGSRNGTKVNTRKISAPAELKAGDIIGIGDQTIVCMAENSSDDDSADKDENHIHRADALPEIDEKKIESAKDVPPPLVEAPAKKPQKLISLSSSVKKNDAGSDKDRKAGSVKKIVFSPVAPKSPADNDKAADKKETAAPASVAPPPVPDKDIDDKKASADIADALKMEHLFSRKKGHGDVEAEKSEDKGGRKRSNLLFFVSVICGTAIFISLFFHLVVRPQTRVKKENLEAAPKEFLLLYEKQKLEKDNIFVFTLKIENNSASFTVDDLKSGRHFSKKITEIPDFMLEQFQKDIEETDFMQLKSSDSHRNIDGQGEYRELVICCNDKFKRVEIVNDYAPTSFQSIEKSVEEFAEHYGLQTVSLTPEELKKKAEAYFYKAEELFENRQAKVENLREAIARYRLAMDYLEQFSPKPAIWSEANSKLLQAEKIRSKRIEELKCEYVDSKKLGHYEDARTAAESLMLLCDPDSKMFIQARKSKMAMDKIIRTQRQL